MGQSLRATLGALLIFGVLVALLVWCVRPNPGERWIWITRIVSLLVVIVCSTILIWSKTLKDKAPDFLAQVSFPYFERDGLCFAFVPESDRGRCLLSIYFQNRYARPCMGVICLVPTKVIFEDVFDLPEFSAELTCAGGEFGKMYRVWTPPVRFRNKPILWDVAAHVKYPKGRGALLRFRDGSRVGTEVKVPGWRQVLRVIGALAWHVHSDTTARVKLQFCEPTLPSEDSIQWTRENLWQAEDSVATINAAAKHV